MLLKIDNLISDDLNQRLVTTLKKKVQSTGAAEGEEDKTLNQDVLRAVAGNREIDRRYFPRNWGLPVFASNSIGQERKWQTDPAVSGNAPRIRIDLCVVLFLSDPASYKGGSLILQESTQGSKIKLDAGSGLILPGGTIRRFEEITEGHAFYASIPFQSLVREMQGRAILYDIDLARQKVLAREPGSDEAMLLLRAHSNLLRLWAEV